MTNDPQNEIEKLLTDAMPETAVPREDAIMAAVSAYKQEKLDRAMQAGTTESPQLRRRLLKIFSPYNVAFACMLGFVVVGAVTSVGQSTKNLFQSVANRLANVSNV